MCFPHNTVDPIEIKIGSPPLDDPRDGFETLDKPIRVAGNIANANAEAHVFAARATLALLRAVRDAGSAP